MPGETGKAFRERWLCRNSEKGRVAAIAGAQEAGPGCVVYLSPQATLCEGFVSSGFTSA